MVAAIPPQFAPRALHAGSEASTPAPQHTWLQAATMVLGSLLQRVLPLLLLVVSHQQAASGAVPPSIAVWPMPTSVHSAAAGSSAAAIAATTEATLPIVFTNFSFEVTTDSPDGVLGKACARYRGIILAQSSAPYAHQAPGAAAKLVTGPAYKVALAVENGAVPLSPGPGMNETYVIDATATGCTIAAHSVWGALRGLETFSQLVKPGAAANGFELGPGGPIKIEDGPRFGWRGLMCVPPCSLCCSLAAACSLVCLSISLSLSLHHRREPGLTYYIYMANIAQD